MAGIIFMLIVCVLFPAGLFLFLLFRRRRLAVSLLAGVLSFLISQLLLRLPILQYVLPNFDWFLTLSVLRPLEYGLFLSFTAGLFEETARFVAFTILGPSHISKRDGLCFGVGHGGFEALWVFFQVLPTILSPLALAGGSLPYLASGVERVGAIAFHTGASLIILAGFRSKRKWPALLLAIFLHTVFDFTAVTLNLAGTNIWLIEAICLAAGIGVLGGGLYGWRKKLC